MIKEAIDRIVAMVPARQPTLGLSDGSGRQYIYNDHDHVYELLERIVVTNRQVSNIESLAAAVIDENRRRQNWDGDFGTVIFTLAGGVYHPDDRIGLDKWGYVRQVSPQWQIIDRLTPKGMGHREFLTLLQSLRPSLELTAPGALGAFRRIQIDSQTAITSQPMLEDGKAGGSIAINFTARGSAGKTSVPSTLDLEMPFARGSSHLIRFSLDVDVWLEENEGKKTLLFGLTFPDKEAVREEAIAQEVAWFRQQVSALPRLLVLEDY